MTMMARHKESNCDGCRRASSDCSRFCKPGSNITESEERDMKGLRVVNTEPHLVKNIVYPDTKQTGFWNRITRLLSNLFN